MRLLSRLILPLLVLLFSGAPALAQATGWTISETKGTVLVIDARGERAATVGTQLAPGATIRTAARSTAVLVRGREFVTMRQNAQLRIPQAAQARGIVQILQDYGSALFNIGKQPNPHFGVETPYLAAVVKGTTFIITVNKEGASLQVTEGAVEAATRDGGVRELVRPGAAAMIAAGDPLRMVIEGEGRRVLDSPARPAAAPAASTPAPAAIEPAATTDRGQARIERAVMGTPGDLGEYSRGFVSGEVAVLAAAVVADNTGRAGDPPFGNGGGRGNGGNGGGNGGVSEPENGNGNGNPGNGNPGNGGGGNGNGNPGDGNPGNGGGGNGNGNPGDGNPGNGGGGNGNGNPGNGNPGNGGGGNGNGSPGNGNPGNGGGGNGNGNPGNGGPGNGGRGSPGNGNGNGGGGGGRPNLRAGIDLGTASSAAAAYRQI